MINKCAADDTYLLYNKQKSKRALFALFLLSAYFSYFILPVSSEIVPKVFRYLLYFLVPVYALHINGTRSQKMYVTTFLFLICVCLFIIAFYYGKWKTTTTLFDYFFEVFFFWLPLLFFEQMMEMPQNLKRILKGIFWFLLATSIITTAIGNVRYPEASRYLASYTPFASIYRKNNIGDYHFVYGTILLAPYVLYEIRNSTLGKRVFFVFVLAALLSLAVLSCVQKTNLQ